MFFQLYFKNITAAWYCKRGYIFKIKINLKFWNSDAFNMSDSINTNNHFHLILLYIGMMCQAKTSYIETEIEWGARFESCMILERGSFRVDLRRFHTTYQVPLPHCSASQVHQLMALADCKLQDSKASRDWGTWAWNGRGGQRQETISWRIHYW